MSDADQKSFCGLSGESAPTPVHNGARHLHEELCNKTPSSKEPVKELIQYDIYIETVNTALTALNTIERGRYINTVATSA